MVSDLLDALDADGGAALDAALARLPHLRDADWRCCPPGWTPVYARLLIALDSLAARRRLTITIWDCKEKFGQMRVDATPGVDASARDWRDVGALVARAEDETARRCVVCGAERGPEIRQGGRFIRCCPRHGPDAPTRSAALIGSSLLSAHQRLRLSAALPACGDWRAIASHDGGVTWRVDVVDRGCAGVVTVAQDDAGWLVSAALLHRGGGPLRLPLAAVLRREAALVEKAYGALGHR